MMFHLLCLAFVLLSPEAEAAISAWTTPSIASNADGAGTLTVSESQAISTTIETYIAATDDNSKPVTYKLEPAVPPFALSTAGILTITANLNASATSSYTLNIVAKDAATPTPGTGKATITVTVTAIPKFGSPSYTKCILDDTAIDKTVITVSATDIDTGDTVTHSIASGNTDGDFKIDGNTGVIQVANALSPSKNTLVVKAVDSEQPANTGSTTVTVTVADDCSEKNSAAMNVISVTSLIICMLAMLQ